MKSDNEGKSENVIDFLTAVFERVKQNYEREQQRMNDPCWSKDWVYYVDSKTAVEYADGKISDLEMRAKAFEVREVWINNCEDE